MKALALVLVTLLALTGADLRGQRQGGGGAGGGQGTTQSGRQGGDPGRGQGGPRRERPPAAGNALIRGRVVAADTGQPVRRAEVQAMLAGQRPRGALTDEDGSFELRNLPAGVWTVRASKTGFVASQFGQRSPLSAGEQITLTADQQATANFTLVRGGVVTGRIFDEFGDPIAGARVAALRIQPTPTGRRLTSTGAVSTTDDTGAYRVYGLPAGDYFVSAARASSVTGGALTTSEGAVTYATSYFPGTADVSTAERVSIGPGQEQFSINFSLSAVRAARISGTVIGATGTPAQAIVLLHSPVLNEALGRQGQARTGTDGSFSLTGIAPGNYVLEVTGRAAAPDSAPDLAAVPITVAGEDIVGLTIPLGRGAVISGTIETDDGSRLLASGSGSLASVRVTAQRMRGGPTPWVPRAQASAAGAFRLEGLVGLHAIRFDQLPSGWALQSVTANGVDVADLPIEFRGTEQVIMRVVLTQSVTQLSGSVASDRPTNGASVLVFADDEAKWSPVSRFVRVARLNDEGTFTMRGLPPHPSYLAIALDYLEGGEHLDPEFLRRVKPIARPFTLAEGQTMSLDLGMVARP